MGREASSTSASSGTTILVARHDGRRTDRGNGVSHAHVRAHSPTREDQQWGHGATSSGMNGSR